MKMIIDEMSPAQIVYHLGRMFKEYRLWAGMSQKDVAEKTGLTLATISRFENGQTAQLQVTTLMFLLRAIGMDRNVEKLLPELPENPYLYRRRKKIQRIRHKKNY